MSTGIASAIIAPTLTRDGKKATLVFDASLLDSLGLDPGTELKVTQQGNQIVVEAAPAAKTDDREKFQRGVERSHERYADAYRKLAE